MNKRVVFIIVGVVLLVIIILLAWPKQKRSATTNANATNSSINSQSPVTNQTSSMNDQQLAKLSESPVATVETSLGTFTVKFYATEAPELMKNFLELAKSGYYDGLTFHRIVPEFVVQGGDPKGDGTGGASYKGEGNGLADEAGALALRHLKGSVAWAKSSLPNSIGSQFYVALDELEQLDGSYSVFGQVVSGMDVVEKIGAVETDANDRPLAPVTISKVTVSE